MLCKYLHSQQFDVELLSDGLVGKQRSMKEFRLSWLIEFSGNFPATSTSNLLPNYALQSFVGLAAFTFLDSDFIREI